MRWAIWIAAAFVVAAAAASGRSGADGAGGRARRSAADAARCGAVRPDRQWVSVVTEDWRWRMVTPPKGDFASVPLNAEGRKVAAAWDLDQDNAAGNQCRAFGAAAVMRQPLRVQIVWQDERTLKLETDAGQQTRLFRFAPGRPASRRVVSATMRRGANVAGRRPRRNGSSRRRAAASGFGGRGGGGTQRRHAEGRDHADAGGVPAQERRALQRGRDASPEYYNRHSGPGDLSGSR